MIGIQSIDQFFVLAPKCRDVVLAHGVVRTYVRTWYAFSSTHAMPRAIRRPTPTIIAHSMNKTLEGGRQEGKPRRDSSIAIDRQSIWKYRSHGSEAMVEDIGYNYMSSVMLKS